MQEIIVTFLLQRQPKCRRPLGAHEPRPKQRLLKNRLLYLLKLMQVKRNYTVYVMRLHSQKRASCNKSVDNKPISGCVRTCNSLLTTSLLQVVNRLDASCRVIHRLVTSCFNLSRSCNKSVKLTTCNKSVAFLAVQFRSSKFV